MPKTVEELETELTVATTERDRLAGEHQAARTRIGELNNESMKHRQAHEGARGELERFKTETTGQLTTAQQALEVANKAHAEAQEKLTAAQAEKEAALTKAQARALNADLKIAASAAGAVDPTEILALLDRSKVKMTDDGEIENAADLIAEMKKAKPHLFGTATTSNPGKTPEKTQTGAKKAMEMTDEEFEAAMKMKAYRKPN